MTQFIFCFSYFFVHFFLIFCILRVKLLHISWVLLTLIPSQRDTARSGRRARSVRIERNAGISAAPAHIAPKFINDNYIT